MIFKLSLPLSEWIFQSVSLCFQFIALPRVNVFCGAIFFVEDKFFCVFSFVGKQKVTIPKSVQLCLGDVGDLANVIFLY